MNPDPRRPAPADAARPRAERARRIADVLRQQITAGAHPDGFLPDERALGAQFGASRNAVREALALLRAEGLVTRRPGVGTTVTARRHRHGLDRLAGLAEALDAYGEVVNEVRAARLDPAPPPAVAARLRLPTGTGAVYLERLRRLNGEPLSLDTTYLPVDPGRALLERDLVHRDVFALIEEVTGQPLGRAEVTVHAVTASAPVAALLGVAPGAALFAIDRLTRLADGRPVDAETLYVRADRLTLRATVHRAAPAGLVETGEARKAAEAGEAGSGENAGSGQTAGSGETGPTEVGEPAGSGAPGEPRNPGAAPRPGATPRPGEATPDADRAAGSAGTAGTAGPAPDHRPGAAR